MGWKFAQRFKTKMIFRDGYSEMSLLVTHKEIFSHCDQSAEYVLFWSLQDARSMQGSDEEAQVMKGWEWSWTTVESSCCCAVIYWTHVVYENNKNHEKSSKHRRKLRVKEGRENWSNEFGVLFVSAQRSPKTQGSGSCRVQVQPWASKKWLLRQQTPCRIPSDPQN